MVTPVEDDVAGVQRAIRTSEKAGKRYMALSVPLIHTYIHVKFFILVL
jgi:hypothetical protein